VNFFEVKMFSTTTICTAAAAGGGGGALQYDNEEERAVRSSHRTLDLQKSLNSKMPNSSFNFSMENRCNSRGNEPIFMSHFLTFSHFSLFHIQELFFWRTDILMYS